MRQKKQEQRLGDEEKILDVNATMQGTLRFEDPVNLRINGKFEGTLDTKGKLMIGQKANIRANITGEDISIAGNVVGNIKATSTLELETTAKLIGDVETIKLSVREGAVLNGQINMGKSDDKPQSGGIDVMSTDQVAEYLEVDSDKVSEWVQNGVLPASKEGDSWVFEKTKVDQWIAQGKIRA